MSTTHSRRLTAWQQVELARHEQRPYTLDYVKYLLTDFVELHGDRRYRDDPALVGGVGQFNGRTVLVVGHQKGRDTRERVKRNFGQPHPEGFRKALRLMEQAEKFGFPVLTFIDTPGAAPDKKAEELGQAPAIAENLLLMAGLRVPILASVIGEGNSGGALAIGVADRLLMLEHSYFSVVSPEGCASILWRDSAKKEQAAEAMRITGPDLLTLGIVDRVVPEPAEGAHTDARAAALALGEVLEAELSALEALPPDQLLLQRYDKYRRLGQFLEG